MSVRVQKMSMHADLKAGRFLDPLIFGKYQRKMRNILGSTLPEFYRSDLSKLHKGLDFSGLNHYANFYIQECMFSTCEPIPGTSRAEGFIKQRTEKDGIPIGDLVTL
ncbi:Beta-glucosidase 47 [Forsythia ovata]|uniref:Beta-glucosidase 47 n=1 Tax=Forsythia ovata TaxID=205694 RepID=A0ABD1S649_9LAMI